MKNTTKFWLLPALIGTLLACEKADKIDPNAMNNVVIEFENVVGDKALILNDATYKNANGDDFTVTTFNYYVSNFSLKKTDGTVITLPKDECYFLISEDNSDSKNITLKDVPAGDYASISFVIGVDSVKSASPVEERTGALDPANGMYWAWNSGYIFVKMEGLSPQAPPDPSGLQKYRFHIGFFGGLETKTLNNIKSTTLPLGTAAQVRADNSPTIHIIADALRMMNGPTNVRLAENATTMFNPFSAKIAQNYESMFAVDHVHN